MLHRRVELKYQQTRQPHEGIGIWLAVRRLHQGHFIWPAVNAAAQASLSRAQLDALVLGLPWQRIGEGGIITLV